MAFTRMPDDSANTGSRMRENPRMVDSVEQRERHILIQGKTADLQAEVADDAPGSSTPGLVTRNIPSGTQPVSGTVNVGNFPATQPVSGTFWQATQPVSAAALPLPSGAATEATLDTLNGKVTAVNTGAIAGSVSLGILDAKTNVLQTGTITTTATTANQVILTYTVTTGKTFYLQYFNAMARLTTYAATATNFGETSLQIGGTSVFTKLNAHAGIVNDTPIVLAEPIPIAAGTVVRWVVTPGATTSFIWRANFGGYEK